MTRVILAAVILTGTHQDTEALLAENRERRLQLQ